MKIKVDNVCKMFKRNVVLDDISVEFNSGKIYGLIGRNGSGKSVFLKILCGLYCPSSGKVLYDDLDIFSKGSFPNDTRALIEKPNFLSDLTGFENLKFLAEIQNKISDDEINDALEKVNLLAEKNKKFSEYSVGMKQKLGIAQVIMENPTVMIFDEPFNGIEKETVNKLRQLLLTLKKEQKIIIITSHIKEDIDQLADIVYEFDDGKLNKV